MTNEIKEAIIEALELVYLKQLIKDELFKAVNELEAKNDRWITLKPHGKEAEDYKRLLIKDGEDIEDAMHRQGYYNKRQAKTEKTLKELQKEKDNAFLEAMKAKKAGDKEKQKEWTKKFHELKEQIENFGKDKPAEKKELKKEETQTKKNGLLPDYAIDFFEKKEKRDAARDKWHKLLIEAQDRTKDDKKLIEYQNKIDEILAKMRLISSYNDEFQKLINEKNKISDERDNYKKELYKDVYAAQAEYSNLDLSSDKKDIIQKMSNDVKKQISTISKNNEPLVQKLNKLDSSEFEKLSEKDNELISKQNIIEKEFINLSFDNPKRAELREQYHELAKQRGEVRVARKELTYKRAVEIGKILQVQNGVKLNTKCSPAMQEITDKLKSCLDGIISADNFNNAEMTVRKHNARAFHSGSTINIAANDDIGTAIHETMHHLEEHSEHVLMNSLAFAMSRTEGEKQQSLKRLTGLRYKASEVCKKDNFFNPYCGKLYDVFGGRDKTFKNASASEIMSMGVQELFTNPKEFAKNDREYFDFVVANLQGKLWA